MSPLTCLTITGTPPNISFREDFLADADKLAKTRELLEVVSDDSPEAKTLKVRWFERLDFIFYIYSCVKSFLIHIFTINYATWLLLIVPRVG